MIKTHELYKKSHQYQHLFAPHKSVNKPPESYITTLELKVNSTNL